MTTLPSLTRAPRRGRVVTMSLPPPAPLFCLSSDVASTTGCGEP